MALITDKFGKASIDTDYAQATTVKTTRTPSETILAAFDLSKFPLDTPVFFVTYKKEVDPITNEVTIVNQTSWKALVNIDNNTFTNLELAPGYTDTGNEVGDYIEAIPTSFWANELVDGLSESLNADGTPKAAPIAESGIWWEELGRVVTGVGEKTLTVPSRQFYRIIFAGTSGSPGSIYFTVNGVASGGYYNWRRSISSAASITLGNANNIEIFPSDINYQQFLYITADVYNTKSDQLWFNIDSHITRYSNPNASPSTSTVSGRFVGNTSMANITISLHTQTGASNSRFIILGHD